MHTHIYAHTHALMRALTYMQARARDARGKLKLDAGVRSVRKLLCNRLNAAAELKVVFSCDSL